MLSNRFLALDPDPYAPLDDHLDIRTLVLKAARSWSDPIRCQLWVTSLAKSEKRYYEAVSYCWDDDEKSNLIYVNDRPYYITDSLNSLLRYRREKDQSVTLWIDAICINQDDHEEKQKQVQLMREIYLCSNRLTIWLGSPSGDTRLAFTTILYILQGDPLKLPYLDGDSRRALNSLFDRPLWTRIWIVQEIILGTMFSKGSAAILRCGNFIASMPVFWEVISRISIYQDENRQHFPSIEKIVALWVLRRSIKGPSGEQSLKQLLSGRSSDSAPTLLDLMADYRQHKASDARDKVYGLLGISQTEDDFFRSIEVNYEAPASDLYTSVARFVIKQHGNLDLLKHCRGQVLKGLPSWVPDWSYFRKGKLLSAVLPQNQEDDEEEPDAESSKDPEKRADQACITGKVAAISVNADLTPGIYKNRESLTARISNQYFHSVREDASPSSYSLLIKDNVLWTQAIVLDELKVVHAPFPDELQVRWEACTEFMVAVGRCKYSALHRNGEEPNPYQTSSRREIAFWAAIFARDLYGEDTDFRSMLENEYQKWLPPVPENWQIEDPLVTVVSSGLLLLGVLAIIANAVQIGQGMQRNLLPQDWDEEKTAYFQRRFNALGKTWATQPYDLRSRPFGLPNVVPDPYVDSRPFKFRKVWDFDNNRLRDPDDLEILQDRILVCLPEDSYGQLRESYGAALGRSFFITRQGYMGLAPPDARRGDKVVLLDGNRFPFILRRVGMGKNTFELLGESYMETVVDTEVLETRCKEFSVERIAIV